MPTVKKQNAPAPPATDEKKQQNDDLPSIKATINRLLNSESKTKAIASVSIAGSYAIHGIKVVEGPNGNFVSMPSTKAPDGSYNDTFHPISAEAREQMNDAIIKAYEQKLAEQQEQADGQNMETPGQSKDIGISM